MDWKGIIENTVAGLLAIILIGCVWALMLALVPNPIVVQGPPVRSSEAFKKAHHYHGINHSYRVGDGWFFDRDGQRCRLFAYTEGK